MEYSYYRLWPPPLLVLVCPHPTKKRSAPKPDVRQAGSSKFTILQHLPGGIGSNKKISDTWSYDGVSLIFIYRQNPHSDNSPLQYSQRTMTERRQPLHKHIIPLSSRNLIPFINTVTKYCQDDTTENIHNRNNLPGNKGLAEDRNQTMVKDIPNCQEAGRQVIPELA